MYSCGWLALVAIAVGCQGPDAEETCALPFVAEPTPAPLHPVPTVCDPLLAPFTAPRVQPPVAVGRAADDRLYVVDRLDSGFHRPEAGSLKPRLFVQDGDSLVRRSGGAGSTQADDSHVYYFFGASDPDVSGLIRIERGSMPLLNVDPSQTAMVVFEEEPTGGPYPSDFFGEGVPLEVLPECSVVELDVVDLPAGRHIEYVADDEEGSEVLVTAPNVDWNVVDDVKLFYGPPDAVLERPVRFFARERDGGTTHIGFVLDGVDATLHFFYNCNGPFTSDCEGALELTDRTVTVSIPSRDPQMLIGNTYVCHDQPAPE